MSHCPGPLHGAGLHCPEVVPHTMPVPQHQYDAGVVVVWQSVSLAVLHTHACGKSVTSQRVVLGEQTAQLVPHAAGPSVVH